MNSKSIAVLKRVILAGFLFLLTASYAFAYQYEVVAIKPLQGYEASRALGINNLGEVVGRFYNIDSATGEAHNRQAFIWDKVHGAQILPTLGGESSGWSINDSGLASGYSYLPNGFQHAALWDTTGNCVIDIGTLSNATTGGAGNESTAHNLNNAGEVVGSADIPNDDNSFMPFHAFFYDESNGIQDLGTLTDEWPEWQKGYSISYDINNNGEIVGIAHDGSWAFLPFINDETNGTQALQMDPQQENGEWYAVAINDGGLIGGHVIAGTNQCFPYYWPSRSAAPVRITMPSEFPYGEIYGINASGQMVGIMWDSDEESATEHAFIFDVQRGVRDLNDLVDPASGWVLTFARDINDNGQIAGYGEFNGQKRGFVLDPIKGLAVSFGPLGLYSYFNSIRVRLNANSPDSMIGAGPFLYASFSGYGLYRYDGTTWKRLNPNDAVKMCSAGADLYVHFSGLGIYKYDGSTWKKIHSQQPQQMLLVGADLYADFGSGVGLYKYDGTRWRRINGNDATDMVAVRNVLYVHFSGLGIYKYDGSTWKKIHSQQPQQMLLVGADLYADFGSGVGLYKYDGTRWRRINGNDATDMVAVGNVLYVHFSGLGLYKYDGSTWQRIHSQQPEQMLGVGTDLYADLGAGRGLYKYDGLSWERINPNDATGMCAVNLQ